MKPLLTKPGADAAKLDAMLAALQLPRSNDVYWLPEQGVSSPPPKRKMSSDAQAARTEAKAAKKARIAAEHDAQQAQAEAAAAMLDRTQHCGRCDRTFLTEHWRVQHEQRCGGKRTAVKPLSGKEAVHALSGLHGRLGLQLTSDSACSVYNVLTQQFPSVVSMFACAEIGKVPCTRLARGYARNLGRGVAVRFDEAQKQWMRDMYDRGRESHALRVTPEKAEQMMKDVFPKHKQLSCSQIRSFYGQYKAKLKKAEHVAELRAAFSAATAAAAACIQADGADFPAE